MSGKMFSRRTAWPTEPNRLTARRAQLRRDGAEIFDLTESNPTRCGFIYDDEAIREAMGRKEILEYDPNPLGMLSARKQVAAYYEALGLPTSPDRIFLTTSSSEAYSHCFRLLCDPGDEVLAPQPSYPLFDFLAGLCDVELKHYPLIYDNGWAIDLEALEQAITPKTKAILVVSPNNPTGSVLSAKERERLIRIALRHEIAIIIDEVFLDFLWDEDARPRSFDPRQLCLSFTISGLSKISALPQMKLGWIVVRGLVGPDADASSRLEVIADTYLSVSTPVQAAAETLMEQRNLVQPQIRDRVVANLKFLDEALSGETPLSRLQAEGGWYAVLRAPATLSDEEWALYLLETTGVYVHPGHFFGFDREGYLAVSLIPPRKRFQEAVRRIVEAVR